MVVSLNSRLENNKEEEEEGLADLFQRRADAARDCVKSLRSSYTGLYPQTVRGARTRRRADRWRK